MTGAEATRTIAGLSLVRTSRGKAIYIAVALLALPLVLTSVRVGLGHDRLDTWRVALELMLGVLPIVPSILVGPSLADEIEDKTSAYLWSRALPRWSIVAGKLLGLAPIAAAIMMVGLAVCWLVVGGPASVPVDQAMAGIGAVAAAAVVSSIVVAALATLVPRHAVATAVVYLLFVDQAVGFLPIKFQYISVSFAARTIAGYTDAGVVAGLIVMLVIGGLAGYVAVRRMATLE